MGNVDEFQRPLVVTQSREVRQGRVHCGFDGSKESTRGGYFNREMIGSLRKRGSRSELIRKVIVKGKNEVSRFDTPLPTLRRVEAKLEKESLMSNVPFPSKGSANPIAEMNEIRSRSNEEIAHYVLDFVMGTLSEDCHNILPLPFQCIRDIPTLDLQFAIEK